MQPVSLDERSHRAGRGSGVAWARRLARANSHRRNASRRKMNFSAVILAGGKSSRMGRDKAFIKVGGQPLLARQIQLAQTVGAKEIFISGREDVDYSNF